jgi:hypothetical protein
MSFKQKLLRFLAALGILGCLGMGYLARPVSPFVRDPYCSDTPCPQYVERNYRLLSLREWGVSRRITHTQDGRDHAILSLGIFSVIDSARELTREDLERLHISDEEIGRLNREKRHIRVPRL